MVNKQNSIAILGIDASTTSTGVSVLIYEADSKKPKLEHYELIVPPKPKTVKKKKEKPDYNLRCAYILDGLSTILDKFIAEYPNLIVGIELLNSAQNMEVTRQLAGLWGYITNSIYVRYSRKVISVNTKEIKKLVTGNGSADKLEMVKHINRLFKTKFTINENDIADSIGVALLTYRKIQVNEGI